MNPQRILVMQSGGWIGDMVLMSPGLGAIRQKWPEAEIALLIRPLVADLMRTHPCVDRLLVYDKRGDHRGIRALLAWARDLRPYDLAVVWHPTSVRSAFLTWLAHIPIRLGANVSGRGIFLTHPTPNRTDRHEVERYLAVLEPLSIHVSEPRLYYWHADEQRKKVAAWLDAQPIKAGIPLVAFHLGTTWPTKRWPVERFAEVANRLGKAGKVQVMLVGGSDNQPLVAEFARQATVPYLNAVGRWDLLEFGALLERCALLLTCDSGPMHIAAAVGTPVVALFGPTSPRRHSPYGSHHAVIWHEVSCAPCYRCACPYAHECLMQIAAGEVVEAVTRWFSLQG